MPSPGGGVNARQGHYAFSSDELRFSPRSHCSLARFVAGRANPDKSQAGSAAKKLGFLTACSCRKLTFAPGRSAPRRRQGPLVGKSSRICVFSPNSEHGSSCGFLFRRVLAPSLTLLFSATPVPPRPSAGPPVGIPLARERPYSKPHESGAHSPARRPPPSAPAVAAFQDSPSPTPSP